MTVPDEEFIVSTVRDDVAEFIRRAQEHLVAGDFRAALLYSRLAIETTLQCWIFLTTDRLEDDVLRDLNVKAFGDPKRGAKGVLSGIISANLISSLGTAWIHGNRGVHYNITGITQSSAGAAAGQTNLLANAEQAVIAAREVVGTFLDRNPVRRDPADALTLIARDWLGSSTTPEIVPLLGLSRVQAAIAFDGRVAARIDNGRLETIDLTAGPARSWQAGPEVGSGQRLLALMRTGKQAIRCLLSSSSEVSMREIVPGRDLRTLETLPWTARAGVLTDRGTWLIDTVGALRQDPWQQGGVHIRGFETTRLVDVDASGRQHDQHQLLGFLSDGDTGSVVTVLRFSKGARAKPELWSAATTHRARRLNMTRRLEATIEVVAEVVHETLTSSDFHLMGT